MMIAFAEGNVRFIRKESVVLDVHGLGYEIYTARPMNYTKDTKVFFYTWMQVREDGISLFGFEQQEEYELFVSLLKVKGVGPKLALKALAAMDAKDLLKAIEEGNVKILKSLPGIGQKMAGQIILDLQGKVVLSNEAKASMPSNPVWAEVKEALGALGCAPAEIAALEPEFIGNTTDPVEVMLRKALMQRAKRNGV